MNIDERLTQIAGALERLDERTLAIQKEVSGNGQPGLKQRVETLESSKNKVVGGAAVVGSMGAILWGALEYVFHFMKTKQ